MVTKDKPNKVTATLKIVVTGEFYDEEASEETLRYCAEQALEDAGFDVDVSVMHDRRIMSACGLESRPRWIDMGAIKGHRYNYMCSCCGETVHKRLLPKVCPNCKAEMKLT